MAWRDSAARTSRRRSPLHAVELLHKLIMESTERVILVTLAPKTNAAMLLTVYPDVATRLEQIIFMGGSVSGGNVTASQNSTSGRTPRLPDA